MINKNDIYLYNNITFSYNKELFIGNILNITNKGFLISYKKQLNKEKYSHIDNEIKEYILDEHINKKRKSMFIKWDDTNIGNNYNVSLFKIKKVEKTYMNEEYGYFNILNISKFRNEIKEGQEVNAIYFSKEDSGHYIDRFIVMKKKLFGGIKLSNYEGEIEVSLMDILP